MHVFAFSLLFSLLSTQPLNAYFNVWQEYLEQTENAIVEWIKIAFILISTSKLRNWAVNNMREKYKSI